MGVQRDLLLLAARWVHVLMRVQVATLGIVVAEADTCAKCNVGRNIGHALGVEGRLELAAHEAIAITRVDKADEVDGEHAHVESDRNDDETERASKQVLEPNSGGDILGVSDKNPELQRSERTNPGNSEKANPLNAEGGSEGNTRCRQPEELQECPE